MEQKRAVASSPTHPVDEDVARQGGGGLLQAAEAVHDAAVVKGGRDFCQASTCQSAAEIKKA